jgi:hypothetical protein
MFSRKKFSFSVDAQSLEQSIKKVSAINNAATFFIVIYRKSVCIASLSNDTFVLLNVPNATTSDEAGVFGFDAEILPGLIKGKSILDFNFTGSECTFKQVKGKYSGKIVVTDVSDDQLSQLTMHVSEKTVDAVKMPSEVWSSIREGISSTAVKDVYQNTILTSFVKIADGKLQVSSFDHQHLGYYSCKASNLEFKIALPQTHFSMIERISSGMDTKFAVSKAKIRAQGNGFIVVLPATQVEDSGFDMAYGLIKSLQKPEYECILETEKLLSTVSNIYTLYSNNVNFVVTAKNDVLSISLSTASGSASDSMRVKTTSTSCKFSVDPRLYMDVLNLAKQCKTITMKVSDKVVSFYGKLQSANICIACARVE